MYLQELRNSSFLFLCECRHLLQVRHFVYIHLRVMNNLTMKMVHRQECICHELFLYQQRASCLQFICILLRVG